MRKKSSVQKRKKVLLTKGLRTTGGDLTVRLLTTSLVQNTLGRTKVALNKRVAAEKKKMAKTGSVYTVKSYMRDNQEVSGAISSLGRMTLEEMALKYRR